MILRILRAAMFRPWELEDEETEYSEDFAVVKEGAPEDWEFRVSPDEKLAAVWAPRANRWLVFSDVVVRQAYEAADPGSLQDWKRFMEVEEIDD